MSLQSRGNHRHSYLIALLLCGTGACWTSSAPSTPEPAEPAIETTIETEKTGLPQPRVVSLEDGSYVELRPGLESGFAHCCGDDKHRMEIECSDGLVRCYQRTGKRWKQTYGKHCKSGLDKQCYEQTCAQVCEAYWEVGPTVWKKVIP